MVLTSLVGISVFELDEARELREMSSIDPTVLLVGDLDTAARLGSATELADFLQRYRRQELSADQKLQRARDAPPWVPTLEPTDARWLSARLDDVVVTLTADVRDQESAVALPPGICSGRLRSS